MTEANQLIDEIKQVIDITSRMDERVKMVAEAQQEINFRLNHLIDEHNALVARVHVVESKNGHKYQEITSALDEKLMRLSARLDVLELVGSQKTQRVSEEFHLSTAEIRSRLKELEAHKQGMAERWKSILGYVWQTMFIIIVCYILYRLGISLPTLPPVP